MTINLEKLHASILPFIYDDGKVEHTHPVTKHVTFAHKTAGKEFPQIPGFDLMQKLVKGAGQTHFGVTEEEKRSGGNPFVHSIKATDPDVGYLASFPPSQFITKELKQAFHDEDYSKINKVRVDAANDLQPVYENVAKNGKNSFVNVSKDGEIFAVSFTEKGTYWIWPQKLASDHPASKNLGEDKVAYHVSLGSYSSSSSFVGISSYVLSNVPLQLVASALTGVFAKYFQSLITEGLSWVFTQVAVRLSTFLAEAGWESAAIVLTETTISRIAWCIAGPLAALVYLVINWLFSFLFKEYVLVIDAYNFDPNSDWQTDDKSYQDNVDVAGGGVYKGLNAPKYVPPSGGITPPGFQPIDNLDGVISYMSYTLTNASKFLQGLTIGQQYKAVTGGGSFMAKYDLRRLADNRIGLQEGTGDLKDYVVNKPWVNGHSTQITVGGLVTTGYTPDLSGAEKNIYNYLINIGNGKIPKAVSLLSTSDTPKPKVAVHIHNYDKTSPAGEVEVHVHYH